MREQLLALEKKMRDNIYEFAEENSNKSVEEILTMLGIKEYTLKDGIYHFTTYEIDTNDLIYMTYDGMWLNVHNTRDGDNRCEYTLFYNNHGSLNEKTELSYHTPISDEIDKQMIDGYIYSISDLLTYNAPCKVEK